MLTPAAVRLLTSMVLKAAIEHEDVQAARVLLDRAMGRVRNGSMPDIGFDLGNGLKTPTDITAATNALLAAIAAGKIAPEDGQRAATLIEMARKAIDTQDQEQRLVELETRLKKGR